MIQGNDQVSVGFWKEQCQSLFDICKNLKEDNEKLVENLGNLSEHAIMGGGHEGMHPFEQYTNNQDLLNYLNQTPRVPNQQEFMMNGMDQFSRTSQKRGGSMQNTG